MRSEGSLRASLEGLSDSFEVIHGRRGVLAVRPAYKAALLAAGMGPDGSPELEDCELAGRSPLGQIQAGDERLLVRRFEHGGMFRWLSGTRFAEPDRPFRELAMAVELERRGVSTPLPVGGWAQRAAGFGWRLALVTRRVEGAMDSERAMRRIRTETDRAPLAAQLFRALGDLLGRLHRIGFVHTDMTPRNVLVGEGLWEGGVPRTWLLDLDRCRFEAQLDDGTRRSILARALRFLMRRDTEDPRMLSRARAGHFLRAYCRAWTAGGPVSLRPAAGSTRCAEQERARRLARGVECGGAHGGSRSQVPPGRLATRGAVRRQLRARPARRLKTRGVLVLLN